MLPFLKASLSWLFLLLSFPLSWVARILQTIRISVVWKTFLILTFIIFLAVLCDRIDPELMDTCRLLPDGTLFTFILFYAIFGGFALPVVNVLLFIRFYLLRRSSSNIDFTTKPKNPDVCSAEDLAYGFKTAFCHSKVHVHFVGCW